MPKFTEVYKDVKETKMPELVRLACTVCGAPMDADVDNKGGKCKYCGSVYRFKEEKGTSLILEMNTAAGYLNRHDFDNAIVHYESILKEYPKDAEAAWGHAISTYGIVYARDDRTQRMIPTCSRIVKESILENKSYRLAISECAEEQRAQYEESAAFIDRVQKKIKRAMEDEEDFDVFISFKARGDKGIVTEDSVIARNIYDELTKRGIKTFFSEVTLKNRFGDEYEPIIYRALYSCKFFILVATKEEYIEAPWVKNEWTRFRDRAADEHLTGAASAVFKKLSIYSCLPRIFKTQGIDLEKHPFDYAKLIADNLTVKFGLNDKNKMDLDEQTRKNELLEDLIWRLGNEKSSATNNFVSPKRKSSINTSTFSARTVRRDSKVLITVSVILAILSIAFMFFGSRIFAIMTVALSVITIALSIKSIVNSRNGFSIAALVVTVITLIVGCIQWFAVYGVSDMIVKGNTLKAYYANEKIVEIPEGVAIIKDYAVKGKSDEIQQITLPEGVKIIGDYAFDYCESL